LCPPGEYPSGQRGQTVNLLAYAFGGSNPSSPIPAWIFRDFCGPASPDPAPTSAAEPDPAWTLRGDAFFAKSALDLDVSTAFRFHFGKVALSAIFRVIQVALIGVPAGAFAVYEVAFQANALFHHSNIRLPIRVERLLNCRPR
jgi:hypothetical protein